MENEHYYEGSKLKKDPLYYCPNCQSSKVSRPGQSHNLEVVLIECKKCEFRYIYHNSKLEEEDLLAI